jgi:hypothetical protein
MIVEWLIFGGVVFYVLLAILTFIIVLCVHNQCEGHSIFILGLFLLAWFLAGDMRHVIQADPMRILWYPLAYLGIGFLWCFPQWVLFLDRIKRAYKEELVSYLGCIKKKSLEKLDWKVWQDRCRLDLFCDAGLVFDGDTGVLTPPQFNENKGRIAGWVILWPWSMLDSLLGDVIKRFVDWCVSLYKRTFQAISNWMFRGM